MLESVVGVECVKFFLCLDGCKSPDDEVVSTLVADFVAGNVVGEVVKEFREECNLEQLVEGDEP